MTAATGATVVSDLDGALDEFLSDLGFALPHGGDGIEGHWTSRDLGRIRLVSYVDDERAEMIVFDRPQGWVDYRVAFSGSTPLPVVFAAITVAVAS